MTIKQATDYDLVAGILLGGYMKAIGTNEWRKAIHIMNLMNSSLTPNFRINDLPKFDVPTTVDGDTYYMDYAMEYCEKYMPLILQANALERLKLYQSYKNAE
jgi:hypothetical protein